MNGERGTFSCPICGQDTPHHHTDDEITAHRIGRAPAAWIDNSGHPKHLSYLQGARERQLYGPLRPLYETAVQWPAGLLGRVKAALSRVENDRAPRSIPADPNSDVDLVLTEVQYLIEGKWPPLWIAGSAATLGVQGGPPDSTESRNRTGGENHA